MSDAKCRINYNKGNDAAIAAYQQYLTLVPDNIQCTIKLARLYSALDLVENANPLHRKTREKFSDKEAAQQLLAYLD